MRRWILVMAWAAIIMVAIPQTFILAQSGNQIFSTAPGTLAFTPNRGQWDDSLQYRADGRGVTLWFTATGTYYQFSQVVPLDTVGRTGIPDRHRQQDTLATMMVHTGLVGATVATASPQTPLPYRTNYLLGSDPAGWHTDVPSYGALTYQGVYPGIDLKFYGDSLQLEYDFVVNPGADPKQIQIQYTGIKSLAVNGTGDLEVTTNWGILTEHKPLVYQMVNGVRTAVEGQYTVQSATAFGFAMPQGYNPLLPLVIDPVLTYGTFLGGMATDRAFAIAVDKSGYAYVTGETKSPNFPTVNPLDGSYNGGSWDAFVSKLSPDGLTLEYSTYIGGSNLDRAWGIAVDDNGRAYLTGETRSTNFPTHNARQSKYSGSAADAFVLELSAGGDSLEYSTYLGGSLQDAGYGIAVDSRGRAYVTGYTHSSDFPTQNALYPTFGGGDGDAFVARLSSDGSSLDFST